MWPGVLDGCAAGATGKENAALFPWHIRFEAQFPNSAGEDLVVFSRLPPLIGPCDGTLANLTLPAWNYIWDTRKRSRDWTMSSAFFIRGGFRTSVPNVYD